MSMDSLEIFNDGYTIEWDFEWVYWVAYCGSRVSEKFHCQEEAEEWLETHRTGESKCS